MNSITQSQAIGQFIDAMRAAGLEPPEAIKDSGKLERFSASGKRRDDSGWYVYHADGVPAGAFGDWRQGISTQWCANIGRSLSPEEVKANRERMEQGRQQAEAERQRKAKQAAATAKKLLDGAPAAAEDHPYLVRKQVTAANANLYELPIERVTEIIGYRPKSKGEPLQGRILLAPVMVNGALSSVEMIGAGGHKSALAAATKAGGAWTPEPIPAGAPVIVIAEGISTALSVKLATGYPVVAALSHGNLEAAARQYRESHPGASIVLAADLDKQTGGADQKAVAAGKAVGGLVAVPNITLDVGTDFNDQHVAHGLDAVRASVQAVLGESAGDRDHEVMLYLHGHPKKADTAPALSNSGVSEVSGVQATNDAGSGCNPIKSSGVSGVSGDETTEPATAAAPSPIPGADQRPRFVVLDDWHVEGERRWRPGVWFFGLKQEKSGDITLTETWICSPLHLDATTHDAQANNFGRLLRFKTSVKTWREWAMPMDLLGGDGADLRRELLGMGLELDPNARNLLNQYLSQPAPKRRIRCATVVGWCGGDAFILPDGAIGPKASSVIFQSGERIHEEYTVGGTLDGWQCEISTQASGNPLLTLALSAAFAGPVLAKVNGESGGLHFIGFSSTGKSTAIDVACSVWGGPSFKRSWRSTANGMEGAASMFNDNLLALDEISECDPREVGSIVYALGNGTGKQRAGRTGRARSVTRWRCSVLSSGERSIATTMNEAGYRIKAGQEVRLLNIPAARQHGLFDELHTHPSGAAFADHLKRAAATHYGHAGRAFLERLTRDNRNCCGYLEQIKSLPDFNPPDAQSQDRRAATRFAVLALAGELASEYGITGWTEGLALEAALVGFQAWRAMRGGGNEEPKQITAAVRSFIERHGDSRFSGFEQADAIRRDRAGWFEDTSDGRLYWFNSDGLREALKGFDFKRGLDVLEQAGVIPKAGPDGKRARLKRFAGHAVKVYPVNATALEEIEHGH